MATRCLGISPICLFLRRYPGRELQSLLSHRGQVLLLPRAPDPYACLDNKLCKSVPGLSAHFRSLRGSCTDRVFEDDVCPKLCTKPVPSSVRSQTVSLRSLFSAISYAYYGTSLQLDPTKKPQCLAAHPIRIFVSSDCPLYCSPSYANMPWEPFLSGRVLQLEFTRGRKY